ncbi:DNA/RNA helicase domain-containing protein [Paraburkholderia domus]|uniref:DNA/RNA helicase domain-containing protein n=1 Tax=Paraburkholderia domus TaxID=2793075 RepID=UPI0039A78750
MDACIPLKVLSSTTRGSSSVRTCASIHLKTRGLGDKTKSHDSTVKKSKDDFTRLVKNTYRVLLSRGMKGCYVCFADAETEAYFRSHVADASH